MAADLPKEVKAEFESAARSLALVHTHSADIYRHQRRVCNDPRAGRSRRCRSPRHPPGPGGRPAPPRRPSPLAGLPTTGLATGRAVR